MRLLTFHGGIHPPENKEITEGIRIEKAPLPSRVVIPISQHIGAPSKVVVTEGDEVKTGQVIAEASGFVSVPQHSSVTGKVVKIGKMPHPTAGKMDAVVIERTGNDEWELLEPHEGFEKFGSTELKSRIRDAGIVGMGGAGFPTHVKLSPPENKPIDTLIINGAECETYLTADHHLMLEHAEEIVHGTQILMKILNLKKAYIGVENNKMDAVREMERVCKDKSIEVVVLKTKYPQGGEKNLIKAITGREVPANGGLPFDVGVVVQNVGTAFAIYEAVEKGKPLVERVVTISGKGIKNPANLLVRIGTTFSDIINFCGGLKENVKEVVSGGTMMGFAQTDLETPVLKGTSGILFLTSDEISKPQDRVCIRCGRCITHCPVGLEPTTIVELIRHRRFDEAANIGLMDCIECGVCAYICPAKIDHVRYIRRGKKVISALRKGAKKK